MVLVRWEEDLAVEEEEKEGVDSSTSGEAPSAKGKASAKPPANVDKRGSAAYVDPPSLLAADADEEAAPVGIVSPQQDPEAVVSGVEAKALAPGAPRLRIVDTFHSYVRPTWQPQLSEFCVRFTGITQVSARLYVCMVAGRYGRRSAGRISKRRADAARRWWMRHRRFPRCSRNSRHGWTSMGCGTGRV